MYWLLLAEGAEAGKPQPRISVRCSCLGSEGEISSPTPGHGSSLHVLPVRECDQLNGAGNRSRGSASGAVVRGNNWIYAARRDRWRDGLNRSDSAIAAVRLQCR